MKKIGLAITYATILQQTQIKFTKKYPVNEKKNTGLKSHKN